MTLGLAVVYAGAALIWSGLKGRSFTGLLFGRSDPATNTPLSQGVGASSQAPFPGRASSGTSAPSGQGGGFIPAGGSYTPKRADHGRDLISDPAFPIIAPGAGKVVKVGNDPAGFGPDYPVVYFRTGRYAGKTVYIGHTHTTLAQGATFVAGQALAVTDPRQGIGSAKTPGWAEIGFGVPGTPSYGVGGPPF